MDLSGSNPSGTGRTAGPPRTPPLLVWLPVVACLVVLVAGVLVLARDLTRDGSAAPTSDRAGLGAASGRVGGDAVSVPARAPAREVLRRWDARRQTAWTTGDLEALRSLYTAGSSAGERDAVMLRRWVRRGARVEGWTTQVLALQVVRRAERLLVVRVTDRVSGATARVGGRRLALPRDASSTRRVELRRTAGGAPWRVASVRAV